MTLWFPFKHLFEGKLPNNTWSPPVLIEEVGEAQQRFSPTAAPVHILSGSALVRISESTLVVERAGEPTFERPIELVSSLHIHGWGGVTSPCIGRLVAQGTPIVWRGIHGFPVGLAAPMHQAGLDVRRAQYAASEGERGLAIARALVAAKIVSMRGLVRRRADFSGRGHLAAMASLARRARQAGSRDTLLGAEGSATALYFAAWPHMLAERAGDVEFEARTRRPPRDAINAMLSYAYAVLAGECLCAIAGTGLDARLGVLHQPRPGRAALALDLMEPLRPLVADQVVLSGLNTGQLKKEHCEDIAAGFRLTESGKRVLLDLTEKRLTAAISIADRELPLTYRDALGRLAQGIADSLKTGAPFKALERP
jgi:CRISPR-associated endonuclease Cas1